MSVCSSVRQFVCRSTRLSGCTVILFKSGMLHVVQLGDLQQHKVHVAFKLHA